MNNEIFKKGYWMCAACAKERGGVWPKGHAATVILDTCPYCEGKNHSPTEGIVPWVDFNWPDQDLTKKAQALRD